MTAAQLAAWLRALHAVPEPSVDRIVVGDGGAVVRAVAVMWMPTWAALREAADRGANVAVVHEPTFFTHYDLDGFDEAFAELPPRARAAVDAAREAKRCWLAEHGMVVIRCHDVLDAMPGGVVDCLVRQLDLGDAERQWARYRVVRLMEPGTAADVARRLAHRFAELGQPGVGFYGDAQRRVETLGLGTGYGCEPWRFVELGADMGVSIDDRIKTWTEGEWADDSGYPLAIINHGTSEEWGVRHLAELITAGHPGLPVHLVRQGCGYRWFAPQGA